MMVDYVFIQMSILSSITENQKKIPQKKIIEFRASVITNVKLYTTKHEERLSD